MRRLTFYYKTYSKHHPPSTKSSDVVHWVCCSLSTDLSPVSSSLSLYLNHSQFRHLTYRLLLILILLKVLWYIRPVLYSSPRQEILYGFTTYKNRTFVDFPLQVIFQPVLSVLESPRYPLRCSHLVRTDRPYSSLYLSLNYYSGPPFPCKLLTSHSLRVFLFLLVSSPFFRSSQHSCVSSEPSTIATKSP